MRGKTLMKLKIMTGLMCGLLITAGMTLADEASRLHITVPRWTKPPAIDGKITAEEWGKAGVIDGLLFPDGARARTSTRFKLMFDDNNKKNQIKITTRIA
jgi:hypothetical protein